MQILSKILVKRLADIIPTLIHSAQSAFVKVRSTVINIRRALIALEYAKTNPTKDMVILSLDTEKAFDNVSFTWLFAERNHMGFDGSFMEIIRAMYSSPTEGILITGQISDPIRLQRGTRQGCHHYFLISH